MYPILLQHGITHAHFGYKPLKKFVLYILPRASRASSRAKQSVAGKAAPDFWELFRVIPQIRAGRSVGGYQLISSASFLLLRS